MFKVVATNVVISKGFDNKPALKFSDSGNSVRFRIGQKVYDKNAENETRWVNHAVKAFSPLVERIQKMQLKEGSYINLEGRLDEETWKDGDETKRMPVIILDEIEYAGSSKKAADGGKPADKPPQGKQGEAPKKATKPEDSENNDGYAPFGDESFFG